MPNLANQTNNKIMKKTEKNIKKVLIEEYYSKEKGKHANYRKVFI